MKFFGHPTAKLTVVFANTPQILGFKHPPLKKHELTCEVKTTIKGVRKSDGKASYRGSPHLKGTQLPGSSDKHDRPIALCFSELDTLDIQGYTQPSLPSSVWRYSSMLSMTAAMKLLVYLGCMRHDLKRMPSEVK